MSSIDIFLERMAYFVYSKREPFSHADFLCFEHEGKEYNFKPGTIRNIFSKLRKGGKIELAYRSTPSFHTLAGVKFKKPITPNHGGRVLSHSGKTNCFTLFNIYPWINRVSMILG
jgi:hypothetical protein